MPKARESDVIQRPARVGVSKRGVPLCAKLGLTAFFGPFLIGPIVSLAGLILFGPLLGYQSWPMLLFLFIATAFGSPVGIALVHERRQRALELKVLRYQRLLCLCCAYPLEGLEDGKCPECGLAFENDATQEVWEAWLNKKRLF